MSKLGKYAVRYAQRHIVRVAVRYLVGLVLKKPIHFVVCAALLIGAGYLLAPALMLY